MRLALRGGLLVLVLLCRSLAADEAPSGQEPEQLLSSDTVAYLTLAPQAAKMAVKFGGVIMRQYECQLLDDGDAIDDFVEAWEDGDNKVPTIERAHLYAAVPAIGDIELKAIAEVSNVSEERLQRFIPTEMVIVLSNGLRIVVTTDNGGKPLSDWANFKEKTKAFFAAIVGGEELHVKLSPEDAMSLYGMSAEHPRLVLTKD